jgi:hypothetical protein
MVGATLPSGFNLARQGCTSRQGTLAGIVIQQCFLFIIIIINMNLYYKYFN